MAAAILFDDYVNAFFILLDYRERPARRLQQSGEFGLDKTALLFRIANMPEWRAHVERAAYLTLEKHIVAAQMHLRGFARGAQLFQVPVAEFVLLIPLVTHSLRVGDALRYGRSNG
jgi:hypothetical protein